MMRSPHDRRPERRGRVPCELMVVAVGMRPNVGLVADTPVVVGRGSSPTLQCARASRTSTPPVTWPRRRSAGVRKANLNPTPTPSWRVAWPVATWREASSLWTRTSST